MTQQSTANMLLHGICGILPQTIRTPRALPGQREWSRPKHGVTEGIMMLAEGQGPEATLLIGLS